MALPASHVVHPIAKADIDGHVDTADAFDHHIWLHLYRHIRQPAAAQALFDMAERLPVIDARYPALLVRARQTLIERDWAIERRQARASRWRRSFERFAVVFAKPRSIKSRKAPQRLW